MLISVSHKVDHSAVGWTFGISVPINGCLYWIASCKGEKEGDSKEDKTSDKKAAAGAGDVEAPNTNSMESDADQAAGQGVLEQAAIAAAKDPKVQKAAIDAVKDNPGIALAAARAAARAESQQAYAVSMSEGLFQAPATACAAARSIPGLLLVAFGADSKTSALKEVQHLCIVLDPFTRMKVNGSIFFIQVAQRLLAMSLQDRALNVAAHKVAKRREGMTDWSGLKAIVKLF
eukprot:CAMPEP_0181306096 /NCGR_PEP_ID=MMETSP1101-20121128/10103_1 /TAXON_ID=46948 /ORGANISM="Rhodomonas abbreviata, Strain Caron Lab Isolate" /LENGTH=231 /DNA_ID=CAMNT_0023412101 /DNA_START=383 /DNA_END=1080 /DNA_ORIENTATION=+